MSEKFFIFLFLDQPYFNRQSMLFSLTCIPGRCFKGRIGVKWNLLEFFGAVWSILEYYGMFWGGAFLKPNILSYYFLDQPYFNHQSGLFSLTYIHGHCFKVHFGTKWYLLVCFGLFWSRLEYFGMFWYIALYSYF